MRATAARQLNQLYYLTHRWVGRYKFILFLRVFVEKWIFSWIFYHSTIGAVILRCLFKIPYVTMLVKYVIRPRTITKHCHPSFCLFISSFIWKLHYSSRVSSWKFWKKNRKNINMQIIFFFFCSIKMLVELLSNFSWSFIVTDLFLWKLSVLSSKYCSRYLPSKEFSLSPEENCNATNFHFLQ